MICILMALDSLKISGVYVVLPCVTLFLNLRARHCRAIIGVTRVQMQCWAFAFSLVAEWVLLMHSNLH